MTLSSFSTISDISERYGVTLRALRFYEERGLLAPARIGTTRLYDAKAEEQLKSILLAKHFGYSISQMPEFFAAGFNVRSKEARARLELHLTELLRKKRQLNCVIKRVQETLGSEQRTLRERRRA